MAEHKEVISGFNQKIIGMDNDIKAKDELIKIHSDKVIETTKSLTASTAKISKLESDATAAAKELSTTTIQVSTLTVQLENSEKTVTRLDSNVTAATTQISTLTADLEKAKKKT